jgi:hypothetical protein
VSDLITRTARLVPYAKRPKQVPSFVTAYSYEPTADEPGFELGNLYVVIEVLVSGRASEEVADLVTETFGDHYYNKTEDHVSKLERFESAIKATNLELSEYVNRGNAAWIGKLSAIIAIQVEAEIHVSHTGSAEAYLYRGKAASHISAGGPNRPTTPSKTFGSIATGQLEPGDSLLLATPALIHQVPLARLQSIISESGPNAAIAEITDLLKGASIDRIAGLVIEVTTPELAALQVRSEQPSEIHLGTPENAFEAAKMAATPIAQTTVTSGKKVAQAANDRWKRARPHAKNASLALVQGLRLSLATKLKRRIAIVIAILIVVIIIFSLLQVNARSNSAKLLNQYQTAFQNVAHAEQLAATGDNTQAQTSIADADTGIASLQPKKAQLDAQLAHTALASGEPRTLEALLSQAQVVLNQIDHVVVGNPTTVAAFNKKNAQIRHFELYNGYAYVFDSGNSNALSIINSVNGQTRSSSAGFSRLGTILSTTLSSANNGIFILTAEPAMWFYSFTSDSVSRQPIVGGQWPAATSVASFASNLYLLEGVNVLKVPKNGSSYAQPTTYFSLTGGSNSTPTSIAVDGSIYVASRSGLQRYLGPTLKQTSSLPIGVSQLTNLRSTFNGNVVIGTDTSTKRIVTWIFNGSTLESSQQIEINGAKNLSDATFSPTTDQVYALSDNRLVRVSFQP